VQVVFLHSVDQLSSKKLAAQFRLPNRSVLDVVEEGGLWWMMKLKDQSWNFTEPPKGTFEDTARTLASAPANPTRKTSELILIGTFAAISFEFSFLHHI
jgi:hypothetical protein